MTECRLITNQPARLKESKDVKVSKRKKAVLGDVMPDFGLHFWDPVLDVWHVDYVILCPLSFSLVEYSSGKSGIVSGERQSNPDIDYSQNMFSICDNFSFDSVIYSGSRHLPPTTDSWGLFFFIPPSFTQSVEIFISRAIYKSILVNGRQHLYLFSFVSFVCPNFHWEL